MWSNFTFSREQLSELYTKLKPSPKKVVGLLQFPADLSSKQIEVQHHLRRYVREMDEEKLGKFLRFTTGSNLIT